MYFQPKEILYSRQKNLYHQIYLPMRVQFLCNIACYLKNYVLIFSGMLVFRAGKGSDVWHSKSSSYRTGSTDIPDPLSPLLPIVHRPR